MLALFAGITALAPSCGGAGKGDTTACDEMKMGVGMSASECKALYWIDMDRPVTMRTIHAFVKGEESDSLARDTAERIRAAARGLETVAKTTQPAKYADVVDQGSVADGDLLAKAFEGAVPSAVTSRAVEARVELLPLVSLDGIIVDRKSGPHSLEPAFSQAMAKLGKRGDVSEVVSTPFGYHVIVLLERVAGHTASDSELASYCERRKTCGRNGGSMPCEVPAPHR
jgi:hypothetical protein